MATQSRIGWRPYVNLATATYLLDTYTGASAAFSLRKLISTYTGSAVRVRRSSDNTEQNIGFDGSGNLDTTSLLSFVGVGNGFVTTWYDQSGNSKNLIQTTAGNQPSIVLLGVLNTQNSKPILITDFNSFMINGLVPINGTTNSIFATIKMNSTRGNIAFMAGYGNDNQHFVSRTSTGTGRYYDSAGQEITAAALPNGLNSINIHENSSGVTVYENGSGLITNFAHSTSNTTGIVIFKRDASDNNYMSNGSGFSELIIYGNSSQLINNAGISSNINSYYTIYPPTVSDTNAQAFLNAASITNLTQANAINTLVTELKSAGIWTKMKAIYPFVGGSAQSHKFDLKDPRDLDAAFRLTFSGGWTHSSTGILPNGTNAYADTKLIPSQRYSTNSSVSFGVYSRNDKLENSSELSAYSGASQNMGMEPRWSDGKFYGYAWQDGFSTTSVTPNSGSLGLLSVTRQSSNILKTFRNNILIGNQTSTVSGTFPTNSVRLSMGGVAGYSSREKAFAYIGDGISDNEISLLSTAVQRFQTSLSRHVGVPVGTILTKPVGSPNIVSTDLVFNIDPSNTSSYPGTGTTVYDLSGNNYTGTLQSGCYYDSESLGNFVFDGINDYINLPHSILSGTGDFTVNIWVKNINSTYGTIFGNYPAGNLQIFYGSNSMGFWLNNDTAYMTPTNSNKETTTIPRMLTAIRRNGSILEFYLDGVLKKTGSSTATIGSVSNFRMGTNTVGTETMNTSIYTLQAYSRALSTGEITQNFNATKWRFGL